MVPRKTGVSQNFGPITNLADIFDRSGSLIFRWFLCLESQIFLLTGLEVFDLLFFLSVWSSGVEFFREFMGTAY